RIERDIFRHLVVLDRNQVGQWILDAVDDALLQSHVKLGWVERDRARAERAKRLDIDLAVDHADLEALAIGRLVDRPYLVHDVTAADQPIAEDVKAGRVAHPLDLLAKRAVEGG